MSLSASVCVLLSEWISFLLVAVPPRSRRTFAKLLIGCMLNRSRMRACCEMRQTDNTWSRPRLILATETDLSAQAVVEIYAERWGIEPLFHNLKRWWGVTNLWQQSKRSAGTVDADLLHRVCLDGVGCPALVGVLSLIDIAPWRKGAMITAGLFGQWMRIQFIGLRVRDAYDAKSGHFAMPFPGQDQR